MTNAMQVTTFPARTIDGSKVFLSKLNYVANATATYTPGLKHHVFLVDVSGSMYSSIDKVVDNLASTLSRIDSNDYVSIIYFSGERTYGLVNDEPMKAGDITIGILKPLRHVRDTTCFSTAVALATETLKKYRKSLSIDAGFITLMTDGDPVVHWSTAEEISRCNNSITTANKDGYLSGVFTIGYGRYYSQSKMSQLIDSIEVGINFHSDKAEDVFNQLEIINNVASKVSGSKVTINVPDAIRSLFYTIDGYTFKTDVMNGEVDVIPGKEYFTLTEKSLVPTKDIEKDGQEDLTNILYSLAQFAYASGNSDSAMAILANNVRDRFLVDRMMNAFTISERAEVSDLLAMAANVIDSGEPNKYRMIEGLCPPNYIPPKDKYSVLDLLVQIDESENMYYDYEHGGANYTRTRVSSSDTTKLFNKDKTRTASKATLVVPKDRINASLRFTQLGTISIDKEDQMSFRLPAEIMAYQYRTHTVILNGGLNVPSIRLMAFSDAGKADLEVIATNCGTAAVGKGVVTESDSAGYKEYSLTINLTKLPVTNRAHSEKASNLDDLHTMYLRHMETSLTSKAIDHMISEYSGSDKPADGVVSTQRTSYPKDIQEKYFVAADGLYRPKTESKLSDENTVFDEYEYRSLNINLKGLSALPSVNAVIKKADKVQAGSSKFNAAEQIVYNVLTGESYSKKSYSELVSDLKLAKQLTSQLSNQINVSNLSLLISGSFFDTSDLETVDSKGTTKYEFTPSNANEDTPKLVIGLEYRTEKVDVE